MAARPREPASDRHAALPPGPIHDATRPRGYIHGAARPRGNGHGAARPCEYTHGAARPCEYTHSAARPRGYKYGAARPRGFTLIELLVALAVMSILALLSWRSIDGMRQAQTLTEQRSRDVLRLQTALAQWRADLDAVVETDEVQALDFDGRVLRLTRRDSSDSALQSPGIRVVAWTVSAPATDGAEGAAGAAGAEGTQWKRWQSPPLRQRIELARAWERAAQWADGERGAAGGGSDTALDLVGVQRWQLYYHRGSSWSNPLSSAGSESADGGSSVAGGSELPNGVRLVLSLGEGQSLSGDLSIDWVSPAFSAATR